ncbi:MAG: hypothetical protein AAGN66_14645 [Acidobacteriota bacterium]
MSAHLAALSCREIDHLPFGYIALDTAGKIRKYNRYEAALADVDQDWVLGKNFFSEVAPCTQVREFEGRFRDFADGSIEASSLAFDFVFRFRRGHQNVQIGFLRADGNDEIIVTVRRLAPPPSARPSAAPRPAVF